ncbi:MAG: hypothetical protein Q9195_001000 [Heterodermia aff. obscurata]
MPNQAYVYKELHKMAEEHNKNKSPAERVPVDVWLRYENSALSMRIHGEAMRSGYPSKVEEPTQEQYNDDVSNISVESARWNIEKWNFKSPETKLLRRHQRLRSSGVDEIWDLSNPMSMLEYVEQSKTATQEARNWRCTHAERSALRERDPTEYEMRQARRRFERRAARTELREKNPIEYEKRKAANSATARAARAELREKDPIEYEKRQARRRATLPVGEGFVMYE